MPDQPVGEPVQGGEVRGRRSFHIRRSEMSLYKFRSAFPAERIDPGLLHLQVKQQPIGLGAIAEGLQRRNG